MSTPERLSWIDRLLIRLARRPPPPRASAIMSHALAPVVVLVFLSEAQQAWNVDRERAEAWLAGAVGAALMLVVLLAFDRSLALLVRSGALERVAGEPATPTRARDEGAVADASALGPVRDARWLARAPGYLAQLERLRWLFPAMAAASVLATAAAIALLELPGPLELVLAAMAGASAFAPFTQVQVRRWVRLVVALQQGSATTSS